MMGFVMEVAVFWGVVIGAAIVGAVLLGGLAWVMATADERKEKKKWENRYYKGYRRG